VHGGVQDRIQLAKPGELPSRCGFIFAWFLRALARNGSYTCLDIDMSVPNRRRLYLLFFLSGFCSLVYQMVWTRLAFASFGIITPVLSVVISVFMLGLSIGAWAGGRVIPWLVRRTGLSAIFFYGGAELLIGLGAFAVPGLFAQGEQWLLAAGQTDSVQYLFFSALVLAVSILPWCVFMGATFPFMMAYVREQEPDNTDSFSYLYFANVLGAMTGTILSALVLVEVLGFRHTLAFAAAGNFAIAALSAGIGWQHRRTGAALQPGAPGPAAAAETRPAAAASSRLIPWILFSTGFCAMAMEVVWTRAFTPVLKTQVYSFALIVFVYLGATFFGSMLYRRDLGREARRSTAGLISLLAVAAFLPIVAVDPRLVPAQWNISMGTYVDSAGAVALVLASIIPLCGVLGYLTPSLIDQYAGGHPAAAGKAYGVNVVGCILGPLVASYVLLPRVSERHALVVLGLPLLGLCFFCGQSLSPRQRLATALAGGVAVGWSLLFANDFEGLLLKREPKTEVRRDYAASVISFGEGFGRRLLVNGIGMTILTADTKFMVHLPLACQKVRPESALIICFGMGTSYRAALSWDIRTTAVELVPSVTEAFAFYHEDAAQFLANPKGRIVIDDGRRFLKRTREKYDAIVIDPPPPVEAAGSSLLYSKEFYALARQHLKPNGILQIWYPEGPLATGQAIVRSLDESFPHVRCFLGVNDWGTHFLASEQPIETVTTEKMAARMPATARLDLMEYMDTTRFPALPDYLQKVVSQEFPVSPVLNPDLNIEISDDHPFNEYFLLRKWRLYSP
jgi:spermidine synthase/MFS family permease